MPPVPWKPIVVGVDDSPQAARASAVSLKIAKTAGTACYQVHAASEDGPAAGGDEQAGLQRVRARISPAFRDQLEVRRGKAQDVLVQAARARGAGLLVVGGKHHRAPVRWFGGSTAHHALRVSDIPVLVLGPSNPEFRRILVPVDDSYAAGPTLEMARRLVDLFGGEARPVHATRFPDDSRDWLETEVRDILGRAVRLETRCGTPVRSIREIAASWGADLVIVGSHGKGWVDRRMLGSTTIAILNRLPTSLLVVPIRVPKAGTTTLETDLPALQPHH